MGSRIGVAIAAVAMIGGTEILRELDFLKQIFGDDFDPDAVPHAALRPRHGGDHDLEAARPRLHARADGRSCKERKAVSGVLVKEGHG